MGLSAERMMMEEDSSVKSLLKMPVGVTVLGGILLAAAISPLLFQLFIPAAVGKYPSLEGFLWVIPEFIIYLGCALVVFNKWFKLVRWQKCALTAIGIQYLLLYIWGSIQFIFFNKILTGFIAWLVTDSYALLSPLEALYNKLVVFHRMVTSKGGAAGFRMFYWEGGLLFIFFRIIYASAIGVIITQLIKNRIARHQGKERI